MLQIVKLVGSKIESNNIWDYKMGITFDSSYCNSGKSMARGKEV